MPDEIFDPELQAMFGGHYQDATIEPVADEESDGVRNFDIIGFLNAAKWPTFFLAFTAFIGCAESMGLMSELIAVPGMCISSVCFGWHIHK